MAEFIGDATPAPWARWRNELSEEAPTAAKKWKNASVIVDTEVDTASVLQHW